MSNTLGEEIRKLQEGLEQITGKLDLILEIINKAPEKLTDDLQQVITELKNTVEQKKNKNKEIIEEKSLCNYCEYFKKIINYLDRNEHECLTYKDFDKYMQHFKISKPLIETSEEPEISCKINPPINIFKRLF